MNSADRPLPNPLWWAYFALWVALALLSLLLSSSPLDFVSNTFNAFGLAGLWGYIRQVAVGGRSLWVGYFIVSICLSLVAVVFNLVDVSRADITFLLFLIGIAGGLALPLYFALWRYAFRSAHVWLKTNA
jgi:hypothetical protein